MAFSDIIEEEALKVKDEKQKRTTITDVEDQGEVSLFDAIDRNDRLKSAYEYLTSGGLVDTSSVSSFKASFAKADSLAYNASIIAQSKELYGEDLSHYLGYEIRWADEETGEFHFPRLVSPEEMYGKEFRNAPPEDKNFLIRERKKRILNNYYGDVMAEGASSIAGTVFGFIADPTSLIPLGATYKQAIGLGAGIGGTDAVLYDMAQKGEIEPEDVLLGAGLGAAVSPLILYGGRSFTGWLRGKADNGAAIPEEEIVDKIVGASAESSVMQIMGDLNSGHQRVFHKEFKGIWSPFNILNQPSKFLRANGFVSVENAQRILGANMGRSLVEDITEVNTKLLKKQASTKKLSKGEINTLNKNKKTLRELGINPEKHPSGITIDEIERAAQRFSNEINFINTPDQMPIALQSPYVKPFLQFKSFIIKHTAFFNRNILRPLKEDGNMRPAIAYFLTIGGPLGMGVDEIRRFIMADDKDYTMLQRAYRVISLSSAIFSSFNRLLL